MSKGPATVKDFSTWSGLTLTECRQGIELNKSDLEKIISGYNEYYFSPKITMKKNSSAKIYLLPVYDEFIMGYKDRSDILKFKNTLKTSPTLRFDCMIMSDGQIIGTWKRAIRKKQIDLQYDFFRPLLFNRPC